ncbi:hypothetical protein niasHT_018475 [Heterodera trifolii]|uniref:Uncharacterized protein n=1 Tax=Heterodera trifolii TaxID=157864 RepID=A0ABD2KVR5_9BILA
MKLFTFYCILFFVSDTFAGCFTGSKTSEDSDSDREDDAVPKSVPKMDKQKLKSKMPLSSAKQNAEMPSEIESAQETVKRKPNLNTELLNFGYNPRKLLLELSERKKAESGSMDALWQDQQKPKFAHFMSATQSQTLDAYNGEAHKKLDLSDLKGSKILDEMPPLPEERAASSSRGKALKSHSISLPPSLLNFNPFKASPSPKSKLSKSLSASLNASSSSSLSGPLKTPKHKETLKKNGKSNEFSKSGEKSNKVPKRNGKSKRISEK